MESGFRVGELNCLANVMRIGVGKLFDEKTSVDYGCSPLRRFLRHSLAAVYSIDPR
jgi:hypothetical protein